MPALDVGQVLVKVAYSGICGKQLEEISGRRGEDAFLPHMLGHEGTGLVEEIGPGVRKVAVGDHVVLHWMKGSGIDASPPRFTLDGKTISAGWVTTFSQRTIVSENRVTAIPDDMPLDVGALLGCAVTTGLGIVSNNARLRPGQSMAVFGVGGVGLNVLQGAALVSGYPILAIDLIDGKLERALEFGATHTLNSGKDDPHEFLMALSDGMGFDATVDLTGSASVRQTAYNATANDGTTVFAGVPHHREQITIDSFPLHFGRRVIGSHGGDTQPDRDIPRFAQLYRLGKLKLEEQISHRFTLDQVNEAIELVKDGGAGRCLISME